MNISIFISLFSIVVSLLSLAFAMYSWSNANRPLVTARVTSAGKAGALNLLLENTGNRPAKNIVLKVNKKDVENAQLKKEIPIDASRCFFSDVLIPVLANNHVLTNAFWHLGHNNSWIPNAKIPLSIHYEDLDGRKYK
ncbi:hypothetical protein [Acinetobacter sp. NCu2D-2]|uniref:hypothetical protein n=1 Tax=Acinetobacter sp. NCu2D-2 TaxID=1608473 RepID=UPI000ABAFD74|nr:hypothetical protein [Acinetobacter sp. NCu2D-2]